MVRDRALYSNSLPVWPRAVISHSVTPGGQSQRQDDTGPSGQEEHTHTQQHRQEGRKQGAERKHKTHNIVNTE